MDKEELVKKIHGCEIGHELNNEIRKLAKENNLIIVYGASDDLMEFEGALYDEVGVFDGGFVYLNKQELLNAPDRDCDDCFECPFFQKEKEKYNKIEAVWDNGEYDWSYRTDITHATFDIMEDNNKYCRGIIFAIDDLKGVEG